MLAVIAFVRGTTCRNGAVFTALAARAFPSFLIRWRAPCVVLAYAAPGILGLLSALGYQYAAVELSAYFVQTALLLIGAVVVYNLALRWLRMAQARMAVELERERSASGTAGEESEGRDTYPVDLATMGQHSRMIFRNLVGWSVAIGLFWIWRDVLPALGALVGCPDGLLVGCLEGRIVGCLEGWPVGCLEGCPEGLVGSRVGCLEGCPVGRPKGCRDGWPEGCTLGCMLGCLLGCLVG
jgi:hypothetical protein